MRIAITGAAGFLGRATVESAKRQGHQVICIARSSLPGEVVRIADLRDASAVDGVFDEVDVIIHLAASKQGSFHDQYPSTVKATENVLREAERVGVSRVVLVSSFAVYDYAAVPSGSVVDETAPLDFSGVGRDAYAQTKVLQEVVATEWSQTAKTALVIARPGVVYGSGSWWTYRIGEQFGRLWLCFGSRSEVPMSYVENCADALVHLAAVSDSRTGVFNVFDPKPPSQRTVRAEYVRRAPRRPFVLPVPWTVAKVGVAAVAWLNARRRQPLRLPGFLIPESLAVRGKPLRYSNAELLATGWVPSVTLPEALDATFR